MIIWAIFIAVVMIQVGSCQNYDILLNNPPVSPLSSIPFSKLTETNDLLFGPVSNLRDEILSHLPNLSNATDDSKVCEEKILSLVKSLSNKESLSCKFMHEIG